MPLEPYFNKEMMLPTFEQCMKVVKSNEAFTHKVEEVSGHKFHIFNYRLANYEDFESDPAAYEMRGLTFLERNRGFERFLHLHKFFNLNQGGQSEYVKYKDSKIQSVQTKEDGSMIVPIMVNGEIFCKTRGTFRSDQAEVAVALIHQSAELFNFIMECYSFDCIPIFEYVSPFNQIVLNYQETELRLLKIRQMTTGVYQDLNQMNIPLAIKQADYHPINYNLDYWVGNCQEFINFEGYVITFENGHMVKMKTDWYSALHHILTEGLTRENEIISWVVNEKLDDVLSQVPEHDVRRHYALDIAKFIRHKMVNWVDEIQGIMITLDPKRPNSRKKFAIEYKDHFYFGILMKLFTEFEKGEYREEKVLDYLGEFVLKQTYKWEKSKSWLKELGFKSEHQIQINEE